MKKHVSIFIYSLIFLAGFYLCSACSENRESTHKPMPVEEAKKETSLIGKSTEEKLDEFLTEYVAGLKDALAETDDKKAALKIRKMKEKFQDRAAEIEAEVQAWEQSLSEEDKTAFDKRIENKPYIKDLISTSFNAVGRVSKSPELQQAFDDLETDIHFMNEDMGTEENDEEYMDDIETEREE